MNEDEITETVRYLDDRKLHECSVAQGEHRGWALHKDPAKARDKALVRLRAAREGWFEPLPIVPLEEVDLGPSPDQDIIDQDIANVIMDAINGHGNILLGSDLNPVAARVLTALRSAGHIRQERVTITAFCPGGCDCSCCYGQDDCYHVAEVCNCGNGRAYHGYRYHGLIPRETRTNADDSPSYPGVVLTEEALIDQPDLLQQIQALRLRGFLDLETER